MGINEDRSVTARLHLVGVWTRAVDKELINVLLLRIAAGSALCADASLPILRLRLFRAMAGEWRDADSATGTAVDVLPEGQRVNEMFVKGYGS